MEDAAPRRLGHCWFFGYPSNSGSMAPWSIPGGVTVKTLRRNLCNRRKPKTYFFAITRGLGVRPSTGTPPMPGPRWWRAWWQGYSSTGSRRRYGCAPCCTLSTEMNKNEYGSRVHKFKFDWLCNGTKFQLRSDFITEHFFTTERKFRLLHGCTLSTSSSRNHPALRVLFSHATCLHTLFLSHQMRPCTHFENYFQER